jgi:indolepyruvate ferredoxin oxidoreductase beta subunit
MSCRRVLIVGTGGQGVLTAAHWLADALVEGGHGVTSGQLHGMAQRGGSVESSVMVDCGPSPAVPAGGADVLLGLEPVECVRAAPYLSSRSTVFMNTRPVIPFTVGQDNVLGKGRGRYPKLAELEEHLRAITSQVYTLDATAMAERAGSTRALNMVMLGCLLGAGLLPLTTEKFLETAQRSFPAGARDANRRAFAGGARFARALVTRHSKKGHVMAPGGQPVP